MPFVPQALSDRAFPLQAHSIRNPLNTLSLLVCFQTPVICEVDVISSISAYEWEGFRWAAISVNCLPVVWPALSDGHLPNKYV